jgi:methyl-accepting chemotaxis protein
MTEVHDIINQRNEIITGTLDVAGPALSNSVEELKLALKKTQDTLGPSIEATMANGVMVASILAVGGALLSLAFAVLIATGITRPVQAITRAMSALADNKLETEIPGLDHKSEIGEMAKAVDVFKQNAIRVRDLTAQEAALQAKNTDLQSNISTVVAAAVAGDFTKRITTRYDNPDLDAFANNVNTLVESVDTGIAETQRVIGALADGDLTEEMTGTYQGVFAELQSNVNGTMDSLRKLMEEVRHSLTSSMVGLTRSATPPTICHAARKPRPPRLRKLPPVLRKSRSRFATRRNEPRIQAGWLARHASSRRNPRSWCRMPMLP